MLELPKGGDGATYGVEPIVFEKRRLGGVVTEARGMDLPEMR